MANTFRLRRRIKTAQNVSKTTRAMQMIATSKLKRAQEATLASRPYVERLNSLNQNIKSLTGKDISHPYLQKNSSDTSLIIIISPDKGLCGGLITNLVRVLLTEQTNSIYISIGKKIERIVAKTGKEVLASFPFGTTLPPFSVIYPILTLIDEHYLSGKVGKVQVLSTRFLSLFSQKPQLSTLLPIEFSQQEEKKEQAFALFEPSVDELLPSLLSHYLEMSLYQELLESYVSEQAARMLAMQNATDNAKEIIQELTLEYNKARQQKITNELLDITGASAFVYA